ncbi:hypothetical protein PoB_001347500 [Plakobranchus ocellatus]|uniref:Uncharacterized protein n=1 Tax=Plakobranchus ocellatus TaxID=259542 RepID=A0AAV3YVS9_9GAST|nr:hypothetical protein PoB_001347500 [Plakobranchus ocellatus]
MAALSVASCLTSRPGGIFLESHIKRNGGGGVPSWYPGYLWPRVGLPFWVSGCEVNAGRKAWARALASGQRQGGVFTTEGRLSVSNLYG